MNNSENKDTPKKLSMVNYSSFNHMSADNRILKKSYIPLSNSNQ
jgi:hypothetical protein